MEPLDSSGAARVAMSVLQGCLVATLQVYLTSGVLERFQRELLERITATRARQVVFDCSGLEVIDLEEYEGLRRVAAMAHLLGARVVLAGVGPGPAAALIEMGAATDGLHTALSLDDAYDVHEQLAQLLQVKRAEVAQGAVGREVARRQHAKRDVLVQLPGNLA